MVTFTNKNSGNLRFNHQVNPIGIDNQTMLIQWESHKAQKAFRVRISSSEEKQSQQIADIWDSHLIQSHKPESLYRGEGLRERTKYYCQVDVMFADEEQEVLFGFFETGIKTWTAKWIGHPQGISTFERPLPAPMFRKEFTLKQAVSQATLYVSGLGFYDCRLNDEVFTDEVLAPPFSNYDKTVFYNTYRVTDHLKQGDNKIDIMLGTGWYNPVTRDVWNFKEVSWKARPKFMLELHLTYEDNSTEVICSHKDWQAGESAITFDSLRNGEYFDARLDVAKWPSISNQHFDKDVVIVSSPGGVLKANEMPPIRITKTLEAVSIDEVAPNTWVFDFGINMAGWCQLNVSNESNTEISMRYGERLYQDGTLDQEHISKFLLEGSFQEDKYIPSGAENESWHPKFVYHGFQYVEVKGLTNKPNQSTVQAHFVHTDLGRKGTFECDNQLINRIQNAAVQSTLSNYHGFPTDCPHREKNGWSGDALLSTEQFLLNFDVDASLKKWLLEFYDVQRLDGKVTSIVPSSGWGYEDGSGPAWDSAFIQIPWYIYLYRGDTTWIEVMYPAILKYMNYMEYMSNEYLVEYGLGDWCAPSESGLESDYQCSTGLTDSAYFYQNAKITSKMASMLGDKANEKKYQELAQNIRQAIRNKYFDLETYMVTSDCQTAYSCFLYHDLADNQVEEQKVLARLLALIEENDFHLDCGILGTKWLIHVLFKKGHGETAYQIFSQTTYPSWGYWIEQGATTLWEDWKGDFSRNHHMYSDISACFYLYLGGIEPLEKAAGFEEFTIHPRFVSGINEVAVEHQSMYGKIKVHYQKSDDQVKLEITVPANSQAQFITPTGYQLTELTSEDVLTAGTHQLLLRKQ